jgi:hypothetical protein
MPWGRSLSDIKILKELTQEEQKRFLEAVGKAVEKLKKEGKKEETTEEVLERVGQLEKAEILINFAIEEIVENFFEFLKEPGHKRRSWEDYVSEARACARMARTGLLYHHAKNEVGLEELAENASALVYRGIEVLNDVQISLADAKKYADAYEFAVKQTDAYGVKEKGLCRRYASLKTWARKDELDRLSSSAETAVNGAIEVIIEGPLKLYLMISEEQFLIIMKWFTSQTMFDFNTVAKFVFPALMSMTTSAQRMIERWPLFKVGRALLAESLREWLVLWKKEQESIRNELVSEEYAKNFVTMFEDGTLFAKKQ